MDSATGLLYLGNGQYYDPSTGRFLNRNARPNQANPYVPWSGDPLGALMAPLAVMTVVLGRKKKHGKWETIAIVLVLGCTMGMSLSAFIPVQVNAFLASSTSLNSTDLASKDLWQGDLALPKSYNDSGYLYSPPQCIPGDLTCPEPESVKIPPKNITWITNQYLQAVHKKLAPLFDRNDHLVVKTNAAQFQIKNHEIYCDGYDAKGKCINRNQNFCGQVALSAILQLYDPEVTAQWVVEKLPGDRYGTGVQDIYDFVNNWYGETLYADGIKSREEDLPTSMRKWISTGKMVMPYVNIINGSKWSENGGTVGENLSYPIPHWILITGVSAQWDLTRSKSAWNWVRIFNPFDNEAEYYRWEDFEPAWRQSSTDYEAVLLSPIPKYYGRRAW